MKEQKVFDRLTTSLLVQLIVRVLPTLRYAPSIMILLKEVAHYQDFIS